ncbi:radiation sensitive protein rad9 [Sporothrix curviconia]|uniref:Radiation sensitive protein rad9 n=1 Tax=Sporothrix curviconia TaxID=1260050 RepID=A0ABP0BUK1_9PEZI
MSASEAPAYDDGSGSPTQVNEGRSYDRYEDPVSLPFNSLRTTQEAGVDLGGFGDDFLDRSLDENESGAVRFGSMHSAELDFESPTAANDLGRKRNNGLSRFFPNSDNDLDLDNDAGTTAVGRRLDPETPPPPPPKNPFAGRFQTPLVGSSQLFAATPYSAAFNQASPTSSRPSPSELLLAQQVTATTPRTNMGMSSPMKLRFSNLGEQTPMPAVLFHSLSTPSTTRYNATTPYPAPSTVGPVAPSTVQQSSPTMRRMRTPAPIAEYEPMRKSQERRDAAAEAQQQTELVGGAPGSSSDDEADDADRKRQQAVRRKREAGARSLATVSMSGPTFRGDIVEVPASVRKDAPSRQHGRLPSSRVLDICPESDPPVSTPSERATKNTAAAAAAAADTDAAEADTDASAVKTAGLRSSEAYDDVSFPQSIIDAPTPEILPATKTPSSSAAFLPQMAFSGTDPGQPTLPPKSSLNETEAIPETSPAGRWPVSVSASRELVPSTSDAVEESTLPASSLPEEPPYSPRRREPSSSPVYEKQKQLEEVVSLLKKGTRQDIMSTEATMSSPPVPASSSTSTARPPQRKRARYGGESEPQNGRASLAASVSSMDRSSSGLSILSVTPTQLSREGTPVTANDSDLSACGSDKQKPASALTAAAVAAAAAAAAVDGGDNDDSPLVPRRRRRRGETPTMSLPNIKSEPEHGPTRHSRSARPAASPIPSGSTDELSASPAMLAAVPSRSKRSSRRFTRSVSTKPPPASKPSTLPASTLQIAAGMPSTVPRLFAGMVFGVSLQSQRPGEDHRAFARREKQGADLQARIQEAGGRILRDGFEDLFRPPQIISIASSRSRTTADAAGSISGNLQLLPKAADSGFTALIIDGHSRKAKYMQALALGLPCLAPRWVTACLDRGELVDWTPYLLCAGESSYLGGAMRSRNLAPYEASSARLADVVQRRAKLMGGLTILVVPSKAVEKTRDQYTFLAHVLGASLSQANNLQEAREHLKAMEEAGRPCDWVYVGEKAELAGLFEDRVRPAAKKRKRQTTGEDDIDRAPTPVKTLSDERFIQSLIFGELIEDDNLDGS